MFSQIASLLAVSMFAPLASASTYFRSDFGLPAHVKKLPSDLNSEGAQVWRTELESGHSTPILEHGRIFLTTATKKGLSTVCLDARSGRETWKRTLSLEKIEEFHPQEGNAAMATPASDGERVFVFFGSYGVICYDLDGKQLWEKRMGPFRDEYGAASSPVIVDDKLILNEDHDIDSFLLALDRKTGRQLWKTDRPGAVRSYSTPAVWEHNGRKELLVAGALELAGYNPVDGEKLWWVNGLARIVIPTPLPVGDTVYMPSWAPGGDPGQRVSLGSWDQAITKWDKNKDGFLAKDEINDQEVLTRFFRMDLNQNQLLDRNEWEQHAEVFQRAQNAILAVKPNGAGDLGEKAVAWKYLRGAPYVASPAWHNGIVWIVKDGGLVTKLSAKDGELLQQERLGATGNYYASPVIADGKVYFASENGVVTIVDDAKDWRIISARNFREKIFATPLVHEEMLYIRTEKALYAFGGNR
jgi:outer membrane protein assembly factor BamB